MHPTQLRHARRVILTGGVIACPAEGVYGLGCHPLSPDAVAKVLALKGRVASKGLILIAADAAQLEPWLGDLPVAARRRMLASWPGPVTWVAPAHPDTPEWLSGGRDTLAVRVTDHPLAAELCRACDSVLVSTSANRSGRPPARSALQVRRRLGDGPDLVISGAVGGLNGPTAIHDAVSGKVLRRGPGDGASS